MTILLAVLLLFLAAGPCLAQDSGSVSVRVNIGSCISVSGNGSVISNVTTVTFSSNAIRTILPR